MSTTWQICSRAVSFSLGIPSQELGLQFHCSGEKQSKSCASCVGNSASVSMVFCRLREIAMWRHIPQPGGASPRCARSCHNGYTHRTVVTTTRAARVSLFHTASAHVVNGETRATFVFPDVICPARHFASAAAPSRAIHRGGTSIFRTERDCRCGMTIAPHRDLNEKEVSCGE